MFDLGMRPQQNAKLFLREPLAFPLQQKRPVQPARSLRQSPNPPFDWRQRDCFSRVGTEPSRLVGSRFKLKGDLAADLLMFEGFRIAAYRSYRQIHGVDFSRLRQAIGSIADAFVVGLGLPPLETGEEVNHMFVSL